LIIFEHYVCGTENLPSLLTIWVGYQCSAMTFSIMTFSIIPLSIMGLVITLGINDTQHRHSAHSIECHYDESVIMLSVMNT